MIKKDTKFKEWYEENKKKLTPEYSVYALKCRLNSELPGPMVLWAVDKYYGLDKEAS